MPNRDESGLLYRLTFGEPMPRQDCRDGWERWQTVLKSARLWRNLQRLGRC